ncbi:MAG: hypothetical protein A3C06_01375 [Candidatus Taylorbacteria bacterium RIFCSPHIGHO2_02_FULL_46_13]|uniref:DUF192 domain-containing protein n=1 Tax=Candidatus Taylorbacteria bacterium RIFCSPHIGHO2_02_FULL_46_13 TaxID=1802312 RepID=A0A1G2MSF4_9BACT|nr:MAG: hypothetical protein A3C06_01375 [Candidatus Taylorbacteria bacterium RIFCSPHIGHO2_02_FULL_46_13]
MTQRFKWISLTVFVATLLTLGLFYLFPSLLSSGVDPVVYDRPLIPLSTTTISIKGVTITAEVINSELEMAIGLGGREGLLPETGMWFEFGSNSRWGIWMKDMRFPIDIMWIDENMSIVTIAEKISPDTYPRVFYPSSDALFVLEVPAGFVENSQIETGNTLLVR